jgi:DNA-binding SARP family transcriptional activator/Tfp pilus assembly protein PilF
MMAVTAEFAVLGAVEARLGGQSVQLGHARQQCVLVALLVDVNKIVPTERLADRVWGEQLPRQAANALHGYLSRLRKLLADAGIEDVGITRQRGGYMLAADSLAVDLQQFRALLGQARASGDDAADELYDRALRLWRGDAFAGLETPWLSSLRETLHQQRLAAELDHADVRLRLGQHSAMLAELSARARDYPLDERVAAQLMLALHRSGRTGEALQQYQVTRQRLAEDLGIDPGPELQRLHRQILTADSALHGPPAPAGPAPARPAVPRQLPAPPPLFTGRVAELSMLTAALPEPGEQGAGMVIWAIHGTSGVGKTWLALRWAHQHAASFPDGQLYVNLHGFGPSGPAADPSDALRGFLIALGLTAGQIPADLDAQAGLYRSTLAGKRALVVLDNARDVEQVRPLLPGSPGCLVLVTSRSQLTGLVVAEGARPLSLDLLGTSEARELLGARLGVARVAAEPRAVAEIVARCARLPLALAIVAARAAARTGVPLATLAAELGDAPGGLDAFADGDEAMDARSVFSWSYRALSDGAARLFRLLGLQPGPDASQSAAASLAGLPPDRCRVLLAELIRAHLLTEPAPGRYSCHDLLRAYAAERARLDEGEQDRRAATHRLLDHYLHAANAAVRHLPQLQERDPADLPPAQPGVIGVRVTGLDGAIAWFTAEQPGLIATVERAAALGFDGHAWQLALAWRPFLLRQALWLDQLAVHRVALDAARRLGDRRGQAYALQGLALGYSRMGRADAAVSGFEQALELFAGLGDLAEEASISTSLGELAEQQGRPADAMRHAQRSLELYRTVGDRAGHASALNGVGWCHARVGDYALALTHCTQALAMLRESGDDYGQAATWDSLGYIHRGRGDYDEAAACYLRAVDIYTGLGDHYFAAEVLTCLGEVHSAAGNAADARKAWEGALTVVDQLRHPDADRIRGLLAGLP